MILYESYLWLVWLKSAELHKIKARGIHFRIFKIIPNESHVIWKHDARWLMTNRIQLHNRVKTKNSSW